MAYKNRKVFIEMCTSCLGWIDLFCRVSVNVAVVCLHRSHSLAPVTEGFIRFYVYCEQWIVRSDLFV